MPGCRRITGNTRIRDGLAVLPAALLVLLAAATSTGIVPTNFRLIVTNCFGMLVPLIPDVVVIVNGCAAWRSLTIHQIAVVEGHELIHATFRGHIKAVFFAHRKK